MTRLDQDSGRRRPQGLADAFVNLCTPAFGQHAELAQVLKDAIGVHDGQSDCIGKVNLTEGNDRTLEPKTM